MAIVDVDSVPSLPPGFRFNPSEEQLVSHYLKRKINGIKEELDVIPELDIYKCEPWDLPGLKKYAKKLSLKSFNHLYVEKLSVDQTTECLTDRSLLPRCDKQWYFFSPCDRKHPNGPLTNRATEAGYWKATGRDHRIHSRSTSTGVRKTLVFHKGRPPRGEKTEWLLHEYHLDENECRTGAGLQNAFVLCHVLKKNEPVAKTRGQRSSEIEKFDASPKNSIPSCDNEEVAEDRSKQVEEIQTNSSLPYMTEDSIELNMWLDILLDEDSSSSSSVVRGKDTISREVDAMPNDSGSQCEPTWLPSYNDDFPQVPTDLSFSQHESTIGYSFGEEMDDYFEEVEIIEEILHAASQDYDNSNVDHPFPEDTYADILNGDYLELDDLENCDSSLSFDSSLDNEGTGIQMRPRSPALQSHQQEVSSEGTSKKRIRMQLHKMEASAPTNTKSVTARGISCASNYCGGNQIGSVYDLQVQQLSLDSCGEQRCNSEIIAQNESSATGVLAKEVIDRRDEWSSCQSHDVIDPANFSSVSNFVDVSVSVSYSLTSTPPQLFELLNEERSETIEASPYTFETAMKHDTICLNKCQAPFQALLSSSSGNSPPVMCIKKEINNSKMSEHACFEGYVSDSNKLSTIELQNGVNLASENPVALPIQAACLCENSSFGESLASSGVPSVSLGLEKKPSALNSSERTSPTLPNEGPKSSILSKFLSSIPASPAYAMELTANLKSDKHILGPEDATNSGSVHFAIASDTTLKNVSSKGIVEYSGSDMASSGLRLRVIQESNNIVSGGKGTRGEAYEHTTGSSLSSVHPRRLFSLFSQLGKRVSLTGSRGGVVLTCLFGTAFLFLFFLLSRVFCLFASTFSAIAF